MEAVNSAMVEHHLQEVTFGVSDQNGIPSAALSSSVGQLLISFPQTAASFPL